MLHFVKEQEGETPLLVLLHDGLTQRLPVDELLRARKLQIRDLLFPSMPSTCGDTYTAEIFEVAKHGSGWEAECRVIEQDCCRHLSKELLGKGPCRS